MSAGREGAPVPKMGHRREIIEGFGDPLLCHFCGEEITRLENLFSDSLVIHSLDGDHENWDPANKVPAHHGCHVTYHNIESEAGDRFKDSKPSPKPPHSAPVPIMVGQVSLFEKFLVDYDLPADYRRKRFYRAIRRYLEDHGMEEVGWSTGSVVWTDSETFALFVYEQARKVGGVVHLWKAERLK